MKRKERIAQIKVGEEKRSEIKQRIKQIYPELMKKAHEKEAFPPVTEPLLSRFQEDVYDDAIIEVLVNDTDLNSLKFDYEKKEFIRRIFPYFTKRRIDMILARISLTQKGFGLDADKLR